MADIEKVIKGLEEAEIMLAQAVNRGGEMAVMQAYKCENRVRDAIALLKEQDTLLKEYRNTIKDGYEALTNATKIIKSEPQIVRCKDCKHRPREIPFITTWGENDTYLEFPEGSKCPCRCCDDEWYSWYPDDEWFCAEGEMKDDG